MVIKSISTIINISTFQICVGFFLFQSLNEAHCQKNRGTNSSISSLRQTHHQQKLHLLTANLMRCCSTPPREHGRPAKINQTILTLIYKPTKKAPRSFVTQGTCIQIINIKHFFWGLSSNWNAHSGLVSHYKMFYIKTVGAYVVMNIWAFMWHRARSCGNECAHTKSTTSALMWLRVRLNKNRYSIDAFAVAERAQKRQVFYKISACP
jgi:hypothetical protein